MVKHLLRIDDLSVDEIESLFDLTRLIKDKHIRGVQHRTLEGKTLGMIFQKASTRTRVSFEVGIYQLGGMALYLDYQGSQLGRGEALEDTARVLSKYVDGVLIRAFSQMDLEVFARFCSVPVINGLTDGFHPCQVLSDLYTILEKKGDYSGIRVAYIGDGNNVANSWINSAALLDFQLVLACPEGYGPSGELLDRAKRFPNINLTVYPEEAAKGADVLYTDVWVSMGREKEREKRKSAFGGYQINSKLVSLAKEDVLVMHCLPAHRGEEITDEVMDGANSVVFDQAENRLHVQKAILEYLMK